MAITTATFACTGKLTEKNFKKIALGFALDTIASIGLLIVGIYALKGGINCSPAAAGAMTSIGGLTLLIFIQGLIGTVRTKSNQALEQGLGKTRR